MQEAMVYVNGATLLLLVAVIGWWLGSRQTKGTAGSYDADIMDDLASWQSGAATELNECSQALRQFHDSCNVQEELQTGSLSPSSFGALLAQLVQATNSTMEKIAKSEVRLEQMSRALARIKRRRVKRRPGPLSIPVDGRMIRNTITNLASGDQNSGQPLGRRCEPRRLHASEYLAPYDGESFPGPDGFQLVECFDLSQDSVSFFLSDHPTCKHFVIALGSAAEPIYVAIKVIRVVSMDIHFIDCRLVQRLQPPVGFSLPNRHMDDGIACLGLTFERSEADGAPAVFGAC